MSEIKLKCLIVVYSYHHNNTEKVAQVMGKCLDAEVKRPGEVTADDLEKYDLIGFGAGIDSGKHYKEILEFADHLNVVDQKTCFIFSTSAMQGEAKVKKDHLCLREKLVSKGFDVVGEFSCKGYNTNSVLRFIGGMNKGRPNAEDLENAESFAEKMNFVK